MMRGALGFVLGLVTASAVGQSLQINVERPAHGYEVLESVPEGVSQPADRKSINDFVAAKELAKATFEERAHGSCPELVNGQITVMDYATRLDGEVEKMNRAISAAYEEMNGRLSGEGRAALQATLTTVTLMSADTQAVAVAETSPAAAESAFLQKCAEAGWTVPQPDGIEE